MTNKIATINQSLPEPHAPREVVLPIDAIHLAVPVVLLAESIVVIGFGQSFGTKQPPTEYAPDTAIHYYPPKPSLITNSFLPPTFGSWDAPSLRFMQDARSSAPF